MLFFLRAWGLRPQNDAVDVEVDDLIFLHGVNAYEEARRRAQAEEVPAARHWGAVKSEIGRRILDVCGASGDLDALEAKRTGGDAFARTTRDPPAQDGAAAADADRQPVEVAARSNVLPLRRPRTETVWPGSTPAP